jgi:probable rRNA maturation factor
MIVNRQRRVRVSLRSLERFFELARKRLRIPAGSVTVCLVSNSEIARWNASYRGKRGPTDVLSFSTNGSVFPRPNRKRRAQRSSEPSSRRDAPAWFYLGDIAIAPAVARRNALSSGRPFAAEMRVLILHGMLHLMGHDHEADVGQMDRRERQLRRELGLA